MVQPILGSFTNTSLIVAALTVQSVGCATPRLLVDCPTAGLEAASDPSRRFRLETVSLVPPVGPDWCILQEAARQVGFVKGAVSGQIFTKENPPPVEAPTHTFAVAAMEFPMDETIEDVAELMRLFRKEMEGTTGGNSSFILVSLDFSDDPSHPEQCFGYQAVIEESGNRSLPRALRDHVLLADEKGVVCLHPRQRGLAARVFFSERWVKGRKYRPEVSETIRREAQVSIESLELVD